MKKAFLLALFSVPVVSILLPSAVFAGCDPKCVKPEICRYEAAGNKFKCMKPKERSGFDGGGLQAPGSVNRGTVEKQ